MRSIFIASMKETLPNMVLGLLCACELPVHAIKGEIEKFSFS